MTQGLTHLGALILVSHFTRGFGKSKMRNNRTYILAKEKICEI